MNSPDLFLFDVPGDPLTGNIITTAAGPRRAPNLQSASAIDVEFLAFATTPHPPNRDDLRTALDELRKGEAAAVVILRSAISKGAAAAWRMLPAPVAVLLECPTLAGWIVTRRGALQGDEGARAVPEPLWEWFARRCDAGPLALLKSTAPPATEAPPDLPEESESAIQELVPQRPAPIPDWLRERLSHVGRRFSPRAPAPPEAVALAAGLLQWHDFLEQSHEQSQAIEGEGRNRNGDYWHAIMHRREPDYDNAKYWFRQVGRHPSFSRVAAAADEILSVSRAPSVSDWKSRLALSGWDPFAFVDLCAESARDDDPDLDLVARRIQQAEMLALLEQTCADATQTGCRLGRLG